MIQISYDKEGDLLEIRFSDRQIKDSAFQEDSGIVLDYDENDKLIGVEITSFSKRASRDDMDWQEAVGL
jgi:uncharacterized protein YuzE